MVRALAIFPCVVVGLWLANPAFARSLTRKQHVVKAGDTLSDLARRYGCSVEDLRRGNATGDVLPIGKILRLRPPCGQRPTEARLDHRDHAARVAAAKTTRREAPRRSRKPRVARASAPVAESSALVLSPRQLEGPIANPSDDPGAAANPIAPDEPPPAPMIDDGDDLQERHVVLDERALAALSGSVSPPVEEGEQGQSVGLPWRGRLRTASRLPAGEGYLLRRPHRTFGTEATIGHVQDVLYGLRRAFPDLHEVAIGDLSAEHGGPISDHRSHQSGRDIDIGLVFTVKPEGYPASFVVGTEDTMHAAASWELLSLLADTASKDGGVTLILLDYELQGIIYRWAQTEGIDQEVLDKVFQYPHGKRASVGLVRHAPNHADHFHVRFGCPADDATCL